MQQHEQPIGVIGLGLMGTVITERLLEHGYPVVVWNRSPEKATPLLAAGATWSDNPLAECQRVILSLYSSDVVTEVIADLQAGLHPSQILIDTTTGEPEASLAHAQWLGERGVAYLDAPVSGSSQQTRLGEALIMVGGDHSTFDACSDLWKVLSRQVIYTGATSSASRMKLVSNLVLGLNRIALAEGLAFAKSIGVQPAAALKVLQASAAYSRAMDVKGAKMLAGDFSAQAKLSQHLKDVRLILQAASAAGVALPLSETHRRLLEQAEEAGYGELDNSSVIKLYEGWQDG